MMDVSIKHLQILRSSYKDPWLVHDPLEGLKHQELSTDLLLTSLQRADKVCVFVVFNLFVNILDW